MRRSKGYQDLDDNGVGPRPGPQAMPPPQEIEMASVTVVPDGKFKWNAVVIKYQMTLFDGMCVKIINASL